MVKLRFLLLLVCHFLCFKLKAAYDCIKPNLEITVSPDSKRLQVNWEIEDRSFRQGDWIGLYDGKTDTNDLKTSHRHTFAITKPKGWMKSQIKFEEIIPEDFTKPVVLKWRAIYWRKNHNGDEALVTTQLSTFPNWMENYWNFLRNKPLDKIFIPGTHDSVCDENIKVSIQLKKPKNFNKWLGMVKDAVVQVAGATHLGTGITMTQDTDITEQLLLGIRYLDIRVIRDQNDNEYWGGHGGVKVIRMIGIIEQVLEFAEKTKSEIIIFDVHEFIGISSYQEHQDFINFLKQKFTQRNVATWISPKGKSWQNTLEDILNRDNPNRAKIILSYNDPDVVGRFGGDIMWYPVKHLWAQANKIDELMTFLRQQFIDNLIPPNRCHSAMAQLTPEMDSLGKIIGNFKTPLKEQAEKNAETIYNLFMEKEIALKTNILSTDYFMGMGTVRQAFIWNRRKFDAEPNRQHCDPKKSYGDMYYQHNIVD